jgi:hypothetical protein
METTAEPDVCQRPAEQKSEGHRSGSIFFFPFQLLLPKPFLFPVALSAFGILCEPVRFIF